MPCVQLALAAALCADSLSVAAQAMLAKSTAAGDKQTAKVGIVLGWSLLLPVGALVFSSSDGSAGAVALKPGSVSLNEGLR